jgi:predicted nucleotide-binding protein (sugar kinase/HSP70/actin superfamily)
MTTKIRPYERTKGDTEECFEAAMKQLESEWQRNYIPKKTIKKYASKFSSINIYRDNKPMVGIVGEIYVRCNAFSNGNLIEIIEKNEGEAWLSPMHEWIVYIAYMQKAFKWNRYFNSVKKGEALMTNIYLHRTEQSYYQAASEILHDRHEPAMKDVVEAGAEYLPVDFVGEAILTIGRAIHFARQGASMVVNAAPFGCMPGTLSSALFLEIKEKFNIPFVSLFYDGDIDVNDKVASLLKTISIERSKENIKQVIDKRNQYSVNISQ